jgi:predicted DNA-binding transcriptional regulator YafY
MLDFLELPRPCQEVWSQETKLLKGGRLKMILKAADNDELVGWILSFGGQVRVTRPEALKQRVRNEVKKMLASNA